MLYPQIDFQKWILTYDIEIPHAFCKKCEKPQVFDLPFAYKEFRGLMSNHIECGEEYRQLVFVSVNKSDRRELGEFVAKASASLAYP